MNTFGQTENSDLHQWREATRLLFKKGDSSLKSKITGRYGNFRQYTRHSQRRYSIEYATRSTPPKHPNKLDFADVFRQWITYKWINKLIEKSREFHLPLIITFVDYEKAFDSASKIHLLAMALHLTRCAWEVPIMMLRTHIFDCSIRILHRPWIYRCEYRAWRSTRRRYFAIIVHRMSTRSAEKSRLGTIRINIDGQYLSYLAFADDIALISQNADQMQTMLNQLADASTNVGLKINVSKTKLYRRSIYRHHSKCKEISSKLSINSSISVNSSRFRAITTEKYRDDSIRLECFP